MRARICAGMKRYFHTKSTEGLLSNRVEGLVLTVADADRSGSLDRAESSFLPSAFALRQVLWGRFLASPAPPKWEDLDLDVNGQASLEEVADYYRHFGLGTVTIGLGKPPSTAALTQALVEQLKLKEGAFAEESLWKSRIESIRKLDRDADDLISPSELIGRTSYPGAWASILVQPPREDQADKVTLKDASLLLLPQRTTALGQPVRLCAIA